MSTVTIAKFDSTGYSLETIATGVDPLDLDRRLAAATSPWALFENFVVVNETEPSKTAPQLYRVIPGQGNVVHHLGPAIKDPNVNRLWSSVIDRDTVDQG